MYTAPPSPDDETENRPTDGETAETAASEQATAGEPTSEPEPTTAATDANWTGTVSADD